MIVFGVTGGIGSGKSTVSKTITSLGIPVIDADVIARKVVEPHSLGLVQIIDAFGLRFLRDDGTLDCSLLGAMVFSDPYALQQLNAIMMPLMAQETTRQMNIFKDKQCPLICYDSALIVEFNQVNQYRPLIVVYCSKEQQLQRLLARGLSFQEASNRIQSQLSNEEKLKFADFFIETNGSKEESIWQTKEILLKIKQNV